MKPYVRGANMSLGIFFAILSSLSQAIMILFDEYMMDDCYQQRPKMAWLVSSVAGVFFGILTTTIGWTLYATLTPDAVNLVHHSVSIWKDGIWMMLVGVLTISVMGCYFKLFIPTGDERPNITAISMWLATSPLWVYLATALISTSGISFGPLASLQGIDFSFWFLVSLIATICLIVRFDMQDTAFSLTTTRSGSVALMLVLITAYTVLGSAVLYERSLADVLAFQPYYWLGYLSGALVLVSKKTRVEFREFMPNLRQYFWVILFAEMFGAFVYVFEIYALWQLTGVFVNLITSGHVVAVFGLTVLLTYIGKKLSSQKKEIHFGHVILQSDSLITALPTKAKAMLLTLATIALGMTIVLGNF